jgi:transcription termination/antitermination protein NusG
VASGFATGEKVRVLDGVFANFTGVISGVDAERRTLEVMLIFFGRQVTIDLRFAEVQKAA